MRSSICKKITCAAILFASVGCGDALNPFLAAKLRIPNLNFVTPSSEGEAANGSYTIQVAFSDVTLGDTWTLMYVSDATPTRGTAIGSDLPVTARTVQWATSSMPSGTYFLYGELKSLQGTFTASAPGSIRVDHPGTDNASPVVTLVSPNGGEAIRAGTTATIRYDVSDANGDTVDYDLEISSNNGQSWTSLATDLTTTSYDWVVPESQAKGLYYRIRVTATDADGATSVDQSAAPFSVL